MPRDGDNSLIDKRRGADTTPYPTYTSRVRPSPLIPHYDWTFTHHYNSGASVAMAPLDDDDMP
jgi:hypothetical protein